jgi:hypothetical protein
MFSSTSTFMLTYVMKCIILIVQQYKNEGNLSLDSVVKFSVTNGTV